MEDDKIKFAAQLEESKREADYIKQTLEREHLQTEEQLNVSVKQYLYLVCLCGLCVNAYIRGQLQYIIGTW